MTDRRTALVTGANKGIGLAIAKGLAAAGHDVWIGCRDRDRGEAAVAELGREGVAVRLLPLDVTSDDSVKQAAASLAQQTGRLDVLVNNAGIAGRADLTPTQQPVDDIKAVYEVNVFGPMRTTQAFLPLLKASDRPRVVMMSSGLGSIANNSNPEWPAYATNLAGYNTSKTALNGITVTLAKELGPLGFKVNAACPGYVATDLNGHKGPRTTEQGAVIAVRLATLGPDGPNGGFFNEDGPLPW